MKMRPFFKAEIKRKNNDVKAYLIQSLPKMNQNDRYKQKAEPDYIRTGTMPSLTSNLLHLEKFLSI